MKTVLIDRSLVEANFRQGTTKANIFLYTNALIESGVSYVELDLNALLHTIVVADRSHLIYRLHDAAAIDLVDSLGFGYVLLPLRLSYLAERFNTPVMLEAPFGCEDPIAYMKVVSDNIDLTKFSLVRLLGDLGDGSEIHKIVAAYRSRYSTPLDICPIDTSMNAIDCAVRACLAETDSVTAHLGDGSGFASLEGLYLTLSVLYRQVKNDSFVKGMGKAMFIGKDDLGMNFDAVDALMAIYTHKPRLVPRIDGNRVPIKEVDFFETIVARNRMFRPMTERKLTKVLQFEESVADIRGAIEDCSPELSLLSKKKSDFFS
ncbi:MAG: hypothetical protein LBN40_02980 [Oscillospiraceae bacterium]|jgi:hypothetical protein|nr:hypothetical protein [Oscillospiraceae bacterium]